MKRQLSLVDKRPPDPQDSTQKVNWIRCYICNTDGDTRFTEAGIVSGWRVGMAFFGIGLVIVCPCIFFLILVGTHNR